MRAVIDVLDKGHVRPIMVMGSDLCIVRAARVSYGADREVDESPKTVRRLIRRLLRDRHTSPFEHAKIQLQVKAPISVARHFVRHRMANWNEESARYRELSGDYYVPSPERICEQSRTNKQGSGSQMHIEEARTICEGIRKCSEVSLETYRNLIRLGVARETARQVMGVNFYTTWVWTLDLNNMTKLLGLRMSRHTQWETRQYANVIAEIIEPLFPYTYEAFEDYMKDAVTLTRLDIDLIRSMIMDGDIICATPREIEEEMDHLGMFTGERIAFWEKYDRLGFDKPHD